tara:strand:- start:905 stop:1279 length:375 start_codon:yes stop_codon:yes gene_type:complete
MSAVGVMLWDSEGRPIGEISLYLGQATNNQAEYRAVLAGLLAAFTLGKKDVEIRMDSELVAKQLQGEYKIKDLELQNLASAVQKAAERFDLVTYCHVSRSANDRADQLANSALDFYLNDSQDPL